MTTTSRSKPNKDGRNWIIILTIVIPIIFLLVWLASKGIAEISKLFSKKTTSSPGDHLIDSKGFEMQPWMWLCAIGLLLLFLFRNKLRRIKRPEFKSQWWVAIMFGLLGFYILNKEVLHLEMPSWFRSDRPLPKSSQSTYVDPLTKVPFLDKSGRNTMAQGKFFQMDIRRGDPSMSFDPTDADTTVLYFRRVDPTQNVRLKLWKDEDGEKQFMFIPYEPFEGFFLGSVYVACENRNVAVIVSEKNR